MGQETTQSYYPNGWGECIQEANGDEITPEMFARAELRHGGKPVRLRERLTLDLDADVLSWFEAQGEGYRQGKAAGRAPSPWRAFQRAWPGGFGHGA